MGTERTNKTERKRKREMQGKEIKIRKNKEVGTGGRLDDIR